MSLIPKAHPISVEAPPKITSVDFLKQVVDNIQEQICNLDEEIAVAATKDSSYVKALYDCIHEICSRSEQAQMILLDITNDSNKLQSCDQQMNPSAKTFQELLVLNSKMDELEKELKEAEFDYYSIVADIYEDVLSQMKKFDHYVAIPQVAAAREKLNAIEFELRRQVQWSFREIGPLISSEKYEFETPNENTWSMDVQELNTVHLIVDALGDKFRDDLLERFAQLQLIPYEKMFAHGQAYAGIEHLEQRYAWFRYLLQLVNDKLSAVLPSKWNIEYHLFLEFIRRSKKHLADVLAEYEKETPDLEAQVPMLLKTVKNVNNFETEMLAMINHNAIQERVLNESIRDAFDPFLGGYVQLERQGLEELMDSLFKGEDIAQNGPPTSPGGVNNNNNTTANTTIPQQSAGVPFDSSRKIFEYIKGSLKRCTGFSTGLTFLSLSKEFRVCLENYAMYLKNRCPSALPQSRSSGLNSNSSSNITGMSKIPSYPFNKAIETTLCKVITTGEYCIDTIPALESMMKAKIQPQYEQQVDFQPQIEKFMDMISFTMDVLAAGEVHRMDQDFTAMKSINWSQIDNVEDVGQYVKHMIKVCSDCVPRIRLYMSSIYFQQCCSRLASTWIDLFLETIWQLKRINKDGGGQLLLDLNGIKEYLMKMPNVRLAEGKEPLVISRPYLITVNSKAKKVENILKLVCTDELMVEEMFPVLWPDATKEEKDAILIMKGQKNALDQVHDKMKEGLKDVGSKTVGGIKKVVTQGTNVSEITTGFSKVSTGFTTGFKSAFGDIMSVNLFNEDKSGHGQNYSSNHGNNNNNNNSNNSNNNNSSNRGQQPSMRSAVNATMAFSGNKSSKAPATPDKTRR